MDVTVTPAARTAMQALAERERPLESCGYLIGAPGRITGLRPTRNLHETPETRYAVDPLVFLDLEDELEDTDEQVVGIFHSHPATVPEPSVTDRAHAQAGWYYLILGFPPEHPEGRLRAWRFDEPDDPFTEIPLTLETTP